MIYLFGTCAILLLLLTLVLSAGWSRLNTPETSSSSNRSISIILAAHNEFENLKAFLPALLDQDYTEFELIVVLDRCTDKSLSLLNSLKTTNSILSCIEIKETPEGWAGKKYAVQMGVEAAKYETIALTDADCRVSANWLKEINRHFMPGKEVVLGLSPYEKQGGLLNLFIRFETFFAAFQYVGMAGLGYPYMGVGRNLAYKRTFFNAADGLNSMRSKISGDDDLLINHFSKGGATAVMLSPQSTVVSLPEQTFKAWFRQKTRHLSASLSYNFISQALLTLFHGLHVIFYISLFWILFSGSTLEIAAGIYVLKTILSAVILGFTGRNWKDRSWILWFPLLDFLYFLYHLILFPVGAITKPKWR